MFTEVWQIISFLFPFFVWFLIISITIRIIGRKLSVSVTLSWLIIIYLLPIIGVLAYLIMGEIRLGKYRASAFRKQTPKYQAWFKAFFDCKSLVRAYHPSIYSPIFDLAQQRQGIPCVVGNELHILTTPDAILDSIITDIEQAETDINMVFYIWWSKGKVAKVEQALIQAVRRGVTVQILLDSVGSRRFLTSLRRKELENEGVEIAEALHANLLRMFFYRIDLRQHRKIVVIDNQISYTGSMNMVDPHFFKQEAEVGRWIDIMVRINGPVSAVFNALHGWDWDIERQPKALPKIPEYPLLPIELDNSHAVQLIASGPGFPDDLMAQSLLSAIFSARKSITLTTPYFVPSHNVAEALRIAALQGIEVNLIIPAKNDSTMVRWASRTFFEELLAAGANIYLFNAGLLHTKSILIDEKLVLVGSVNMDMRSFMLNFEIAMVVEDKTFAMEIFELQQYYMQSCAVLDYDTWLKRPIYHRAIERLFFLFSPLL